LADDHHPSITVNAHPDVVHLLLEEGSDQLEKIQKRYNTKIQLNPDPHLYQEQYEIAAG
jgi:Ribonuclease G/E